MSNQRITSRTIQVAVRLPKPLYDAMRGRDKPISQQVVEALERELAAAISQK